MPLPRLPRRAGGGRPAAAWLFLGTGAVLIALVLGARAAGVGDEIELRSVDVRFALRGAGDAPPDFVVVQVDDRTFSALQEQWPFPRSLHARLIDRLREEGARTIAYDVQFTEPTEPAEDNALLEAVQRASGRVVLATTEVDEQGRANVFGGEEVVRSVGARAANALIPPDSRGVLRRVPYEVQGLRSFAVTVAEVSGGDPAAAARFGDAGAWIDYHGPPGTIRTVSFSAALRGRTPPGVFRDRVVVVGASAPSLQDVHPTSASGDLMSGPEIQASAVSTVLRGLPLRGTPAGLDTALIVLMGMVAPVASLRLTPRWTFALTVGALVAFLLAVQGAFLAGWILPVVHPIVALAATAVGALGIDYVTAAFERERVRGLFARFVPDRVVDQVLARTDGDLRLGGTELDATVLFSDLRGFTSYAEARPPAQVISVLNRYLSEMSDAILDAGGTLVAYMGDGIMAVFGAPLEQPDHADRALDAAQQMLRRLDGFNEALRAEGLGEGFRMGLGLNSGRVLSGNVGSERRLEYTAIGDTTNTAARIEAMTKGTPHQLLLSESTRTRLRREFPPLVFVDEVPVRGRQGTIRLWSVIDETDASAPGVDRAT